MAKSHVDETMISGNLIDLLNSIIGVSSDTICDGYSVLPYILLMNVTVWVNKLNVNNLSNINNEIHIRILWVLSCP